VIELVEVADLRASANAAYEVSQPLPRGAVTLFGPGVAFGSPVYAALDARTISPAFAPPRDAVPGWRASASLWPAERFIARIPKKWNGRLVVAGTPAQRSEFSNDLIWSDPLVARGYAYVCGNKVQGDSAVVLTGEDRLVVGGVAMPRYATPDGIQIAFWQHAPRNRFETWMSEFFAITETAIELLQRAHGRAPEVTYAVGLSNGGLQVRYALERCDLYDGGLAWNAALWHEDSNLMAQLPEALRAMEAGRPETLTELGFPPDVRGTSGASLYEKNLAVYWVLTAWLYAMLLDPEASIPYGDVWDAAPAESWVRRMAHWSIDRSPAIRERIAAYAHTGALRAKLIDLASEYDHLVTPAVHFHPYRRLVAAAGKAALYRSDTIPNAQHVDAWSEDPDFPQMKPGYPRAIAAFDELVEWVEG
jgi:hypothetical protein